MRKRSIALVLLTIAASSTACGRDPVVVLQAPKQEPDPSALASLKVYPSALVLDPGSTGQLALLALDQRGSQLPVAGGVNYSSSDKTIATVSSSGFMTAVAPGMAEITAVVTIRGVSRKASMTMTVRDFLTGPFPSEIAVTAAWAGWDPPAVHIAAGGTVTWQTPDPISWAGVPHRSIYLVDRKAEVLETLELSNGTVTRKFEKPGEYWYCSAACWDPPDFGVVHVH
jgi:plastocyanin